MILEAFAKYLHAADPKMSATDVLAQWLWRQLSAPPLTMVDKVLHCKLAIREVKRSKADATTKKQGQSRKTSYVFCGTSATGRQLLKNLYEYCQSYEQQRWSRWIHTLKAGDFSEKLLGR